MCVRWRYQTMLGLLATVLAGAWPAEAQEVPQGDPPSGPSRQKLAEQVMDQMRALRMWKITEELKLDEATGAKLFPILARFDDQARAIGRERHELYRELRTTLEAPNPDPAKLNEMVDRMVANLARRTTFEEDRTRSIRKVLTPLQQAKLLLLLPHIEDGFRRKIREAMNRNGRPGDRPEQPFGDRPRGERRWPLGDDGVGQP